MKKFLAILLALALILCAGCGKCFILVHNHPSGNMKPCRADDDLTAKVKGAAKAVNIRMLDHVIVSEDDYYSYAENGKM